MIVCVIVHLIHPKFIVNNENFLKKKNLKIIQFFILKRKLKTFPKEARIIFHTQNSRKTLECGSFLFMYVEINYSSFFIYIN